MNYLRYASAALAACLLLIAPVAAQSESPPAVRAVLFYSPTCPHCHYVMEEVLPPLRAQYGEQLEILEIDAGEEAGAQLYYAAFEALAIPQDRLGVPTLIVGDTVLVGSYEIPQYLPGLIEQHLAAGGVDWPAIPGLEAALPQPTSTPAPAPVVRAVMFWMNGCPHCHEVLDDVLPPLQARYGEQLDIRLIELVTTDDVDWLYQVAAARGIPKDQVFVPFLLIGDRLLIGSAQIPDELPGLIEQYLAAGGVDWPDVPALEASLSQASPPAATASSVSPASAVVRAVMFYTADCRECQVIVGQATTPLKEQYGDNLQIRNIDIVTSEDVEYLYQVAAKYGLSKEQVDLPMLIIGKQVLIDEEIPAELPGLVAHYVASGGIDYPALPDPGTPSAAPDVPVQLAVQSQPDGFELAIGIMAGMVAALGYVGLRVARAPRRRPRPLPEWTNTLFLLLIFVGLGVAGYLAFVETQAVAAVCGPVGDCNAVQSSEYARLFGVLPIGVLGMIGYIAILAAWLWGRFRTDRLAEYAPLAVFGMSVFGVLFSLYLTYLEPFVIRAVCAWCLSSAVITTALMLLSLRPALQAIAANRYKEA